jgi:hypothetical protein
MTKYNMADSSRMAQFELNEMMKGAGMPVYYTRTFERISIIAAKT